MRLPNGYGSVTKLSGNRRRPFIIKKTIGFDENGHPIYNIIGYAETKEDGLKILASYNDEPWDVEKSKITLAQLFDQWKISKAPKLGNDNRKNIISAYKHCIKYCNHPYKSLKTKQMQQTIDECGYGYSTQSNIKKFWKHIDAFAFEEDIITKCYSTTLKSDPIPDTTRDRFSDEEIDTLWEHQNDFWVDIALILIYSGWRISELLALTPSDIDLNNNTMSGGIKTNSGKNRIVPIHSLIRPFIEKRLEDGGPKLISSKGKGISHTKFRVNWKEMTRSLGIEKTPHECRHTFESLLDNAGANRRCIDLIMGHKSKDVGNRVYNHKTIQQLKESVELVTR